MSLQKKVLGVMAMTCVRRAPGDVAEMLKSMTI